ncbi:hypothetical protein BPAE_0765g00020 [Botrytis paeoniae]|uniref:Uncharacterized protein n=1 Tax=Botrytis paeoniae TaxID=278948 RepID=A0A4Z1ELF5_9HELO|nr:hypothetical protein BPAE_0765g00020 [Botrytis paeoniae]
MPRPEQIFETMKEPDGKGLDVSKRSPGSMPEPEPAPAPTRTDAELEQYSSLYDFDGATTFDADWMGQVAEESDQFNAIDSNSDPNAFPIIINDQYPIATSSASANEPSSEQNAADMPLPADIPSLENFELSQEQQDGFLNALNETNREEINLWYAGAVATQANSDGLAEQNVEGRIPQFTQQDQAILDSFGPAIADEISMKYPAQDGLNMAGFQSLQAPTAQDAALQGSEQLGGTSDTNSLEDPTSSCVQRNDNVTTQNQLDSLVEWTEKKSPSSILNFNQSDETFLSAGTIQSSPMNHDENTASNHQGATFQPPTEFRESAPVMTVQRPELRQNEAGAAQNRSEQSLLRGQGEYDERSQLTQMKSEDDWTHASPRHRYPDLSYGDFNTAQAPQPYSCLEPFGNNNLGAGIEMQRAGGDPIGIGNRVDNTNNVAYQRNGNCQCVKTSQGSRKRAGWETRPDAARPRVRMTEEEFQWLRPNEGLRDVFENQRKKAAEERLKEETEADALEKAGLPRPQPKKPKLFKGGIHIEVWEKDRLNSRRLAQGKSGRDLFSEKPNLRGKRKVRKMSESEPQPESKKPRLEESGRFQPQSGNREMSEGTINGGYGSSMATVDGFNRGISSRPCYAANLMTGQLNRGMTNSGHINNGHTNHNYGNNYGHFGNNNYISNHFTDTSFENSMTSSGMTRNGDLGSMPPSGAANPSIGQGSRPEYDGAHQARAVYSHNQPPGSFHSQSEEKATASYGRNSVPPPPYVESVQQFTNFPPQPSQRPTAPIYRIRTSGSQAIMNLANEPLTNGGNGIPSYLVAQNAEVFRMTDHVYHPNQLRRMIPDSLIDPMLQSQVQFPAPSVMGTKTREHALDNYD